MGRRVLQLTLLIVGSLMAGGCASPRFISVGSEGGIVSIPDNTNRWPTYHHDKALALIEKRYPKGYEITREEEAVTGQVAHTDTETKTVAPAIALGPLAIPLGEARETRQETTRYRDVTEWHIYFRAKQ